MLTPCEGRLLTSGLASAAVDEGALTVSSLDSLDACDADALTGDTCLDCVAAGGGVTSTLGGDTLADGEVGGAARKVGGGNSDVGGVTLDV